MILHGTRVTFTADKAKFEGTALGTFQTLEGSWMTAVQVAPNTIFMKATHCLTIVDKVDRPKKVLPTLSTRGKH